MADINTILFTFVVCYLYIIYMKKIFLALAALIASSTFADARKVTGSVASGEYMLGGVIVTDGANFTTTNSNGKFSMDIADDAEFVYIVTPAGYVADWSSGVPAFYQKAEGKKKFHFELQKMQGGMDYNIIAVSDPQTSTPEHFEKFAGAPLEDLAKTVESLDGITVGVVLGDIAWDELARLDDYKREIVKTGAPFYPVVGNHDNSAWCSGDIEGSALYRSIMGPENYAFFLGNDVVIVLDNIIYETNFKHKVGYADHVLAWLKGFMSYVPKDADVYIAQHVPVGGGRRKIYQTEKLLDIVRGHKVTIMSGHSHINRNTIVERNIMDHNVAAICGAWWDTELCADGTPKGYKVFSKFGGRLSWYYKGVGHSRNMLAQAFGLGESPLYPNSVVANVWDWDPEWKVEWYEDGVHMGKMEQVVDISAGFLRQIEAAYKEYGEEIPGWKRGQRSSHHFAATPSRYAKSVMVVVESRFGKKWSQLIDLTGFVEENRVCAETSAESLKAMAEAGANGVVLDLNVGMDGSVKVAGNEELTLRELIDTTDAQLKGRSLLRYNLVMHTVTGKEEGKSVPYYHYYADYVMDGLWDMFLGDRLMVTGSDFRALNHLHSRYPEVDVAFHVAEDVEDIEKAMSRLKFKPAWISLPCALATKAMIDEYRQKGYNVSVWGIPDEETKNRIKALGPDAVIF